MRSASVWKNREKWQKARRSEWDSRDSRGSFRLGKSHRFLFLSNVDLEHVTFIVLRAIATLQANRSLKLVIVEHSPNVH